MNRATIRLVNDVGMVDMAKESLTLFGTAVSCTQCFALMSSSLKSLDGIEDILADTQTNILTINYNSSLISEGGIRAKLRASGFGGKHLYCIC